MSARPESPAGDRGLECGPVLITGGAGFVGRRVVGAYRRHERSVRVFARGGGISDGFENGVEIASGDIRDPHALDAAVRRVHTIVHLASIVHDSSGRISDDEHWSVTVQGTRALLDAAERAGVRSFVFLSTLAVYGGASTLVRDESVPCRPTSVYGRSKLEAEEIVLAFGRRTGMHVCCLRPASIYGPGCKGNLPRMIALVDRGMFPPPPPTTTLRSFVHVDDVVRAIVLAASSPRANDRCFNVTDEAPISSRALFEVLCHALGRPVPGWSIPVSLFRMAAAVGDAAGRVANRRMPFDTRACEVLLADAQFDSRRIASVLGFTPTRTIVDAVPGMVRWYRSGDCA